jgi:phosphate acyltransferase
MRIAIDIPGGDYDRPQELRVSAAFEAIRQTPDLEILFVGVRDQIGALLEPYTQQEVRKRASIHEADSVVSMDLAGRPLLKFFAQERRHKRQASIVAAVDLVRDGKADAVISSGNTGGIALAAMTELEPMTGVQNPAIVTFFPTRQKDRLVGIGDSGLIVDRRPAEIAEATLITAALVHSLLGVKKPTVGILSNGSEKGKGRETVVQTDAILSALAPQIPTMHYRGNTEAKHIFHAQVDAVGADGSDGNEGLKFSAEAGKLVLDVLKEELTTGNKVGQFLTWLFNRNKFRRVKQRLSVDYNAVGWIVGPKGLVFKLHGDSDENTYAQGIMAANTIAKKNPLKQMEDALPLFLDPLRKWEKDLQDQKEGALKAIEDARRTLLHEYEDELERL